MILVSYATENGFGAADFGNISFPISKEERKWIKSWIENDIKGKIAILNVIPLAESEKID